MRLATARGSCFSFRSRWRPSRTARTALARLARRRCRATLAHMPELGEVPDAPPPFLGSWRRVYAAVLLYLVGVILAAYFFARAYR